MKEENDVVVVAVAAVVGVVDAAVVAVGWLRPMRNNLLRQPRDDGLQGYQP